MKLPLSRQLARLPRRIKRFIKKTQDIRRGLIIVLAASLVIPVLTVNAADTTPAPASTSVTNVSLDSNLASVSSPFTVEIKQSPHDEAKVVAAKPAVVKTVATVPAPASTETSDPGYDVKMEWAQKAAGTWNIDWKLLSAVWQIETGKTWYTSRGSSAGARGPCQFMPGTWRSYAEDGNGDGTKNINDARDCLFASAKLLATNGAAEGNIDGALLRYNHSLSYVAKVKQIMASISG